MGWNILDWVVFPPFHDTLTLYFSNTSTLLCVSERCLSDVGSLNLPFEMELSRAHARSFPFRSKHCNRYARRRQYQASPKCCLNADRPAQWCSRWHSSLPMTLNNFGRFVSSGPPLMLYTRIPLPTNLLAFHFSALRMLCAVLTKASLSTWHDRVRKKEKINR